MSKNIAILTNKIINELKSKYQACDICGKSFLEDFDAVSTLTIQNYCFDIDENICQKCASNVEELADKAL